MSIITAVSSLKEEIPSKRMQKIVEQIHAKLQSGSSFSDTLEEVQILSPHTLSLVRAGESSGRLTENLKVIVLQNEKENLFRSKIRSSLMYAMIVVTMAIVIGTGTAIFTLPRLASFFGELDAELPALTRGLIAIGAFLSNFGFIIIPIFLIILIIAFYFIFSFPKTKFIGHSLLFKTPVIKTLIKQAELARFGFLLGTMLDAGLSAREALANLPDTTTFLNYKEFYIYLKEKITAGNSFQTCFTSYPKVKKLLPSAVRQLIIAGEKSGKLSESLLRIGKMYEAKVEATARNLPTLLEPILILIIGLMVALLALGTILPIYNLTNII